MKDFLIDLAIVAVVLVIALPFAIRSCEPKVEEVQRDTVYVYDTIRITEPVLVKEEVVRYEYVYLPKADDKEDNFTIMQDDFASDINVATKTEQEDSVEVVLPITQRVYEDGQYKAWVSGYNPKLDSIDVYSRNVYYPMYIQKKEKPNFVIGAGLYGGFGTKGADYGLGIMVVVPIYSW